MITGQITGNTLILNSEPADISTFQIDLSADIFYEVVRVTDGWIHFLNDHLKRFEKSITSSTLQYPGDEHIKKDLKLLISSSSYKSGNIKISLFRDPEGKSNLGLHFVSHFYPSDEMYRDGVRLLTFSHTRPQPGVKKWDGAFRKRVNQFIHDKRIYEAILFNQDGFITEGSRSNIFFINGKNEVITPPSRDVLEGITRRYVIEIIRNQNIKIWEKDIRIEELNAFESCFITGTSPKVLPVSHIDKVHFDPQHQLLRTIMFHFDKSFMNMNQFYKDL